MGDHHVLTLAGAALVEGVEHLLLGRDILGNLPGKFQDDDIHVFRKASHLCPGSIGEFSTSVVVTACGHRAAQD